RKPRTWGQLPQGAGRPGRGRRRRSRLALAYETGDLEDLVVRVAVHVEVARALVRLHAAECHAARGRGDVVAGGGGGRRDAARRRVHHVQHAVVGVHIPVQVAVALV